MSYMEHFHQDPRIQQAKALLLEALQEHTRELTTIKPPDVTRQVRYQELLKAFSVVRGAPLFFPYLGSGFGHGALVELMDGSVKYDMITGIGVHFLGHSHPLMSEAVFNAALSNTIMQGNLQQNEDSVELADLFTKAAGLPHCFLTTSGVMANENGIKIALQKNAPAGRILAFEHCFTGRSVTCSQVTDKSAFREGLPLNIPVDYIPFFDIDAPEESSKSAIIALKKAIYRYPKAHALMIFELVQGEGGFNVGSKPFFEELMKICKEHHIAILVDEVQSFARTHRLFAYQHFELDKYVDIVTVGKLTQVCATLFTEEYRPKPGLLSQTYTGSTASILACQTILQILLKGKQYGEEGRNAAIFKRFKAHFEKLKTSFPEAIHGPYGLGAMIAFTPFDGTYAVAKSLTEALFEAGVITFIAGVNPTRIRFLPPAAVITDDQIDHVMEIIGLTLATFKK